MTLAILALVCNALHRADNNFIPLSVLVGFPFLLLDYFLLTALL